MDEQFIADLRRAWRRRLEEKKRFDQQRRHLALERASAVASLLYGNYGVEKVYLYGSLAWGPSFGQRSDIDLMVEGFPRGAAYWRMLARAGDVARPFAVSIVLSEDAFESLRERVQKAGVLL